MDEFVRPYKRQLHNKGQNATNDQKRNDCPSRVTDILNQMNKYKNSFVEPYIPEPVYHSLSSITSSIHNAPLWIRTINFKTPLVSFGSGYIHMVIDQELKKQFNDTFYNCLSDGNFTRYGTEFPGNLAKSLMKKDINIISIEKYVILPKSDGQRFMLCMFRNEIYLFCRSGTLYQLPLNFHQSFSDVKLFDGSIYECELIKRGSDYIVQIFDCLCSRGIKVHDKPFSTRILCSGQLVSSYSISPSHPFSIECKNTISPDEAIQVYNNKYDSTGIVCDGLILQSWTRPYIPGRNNTCFKVKDGKENTVDFHCLVGIGMTESNNVGNVDLYVEGWENYRGKKRVSGIEGMKHISKVSLTKDDIESLGIPSEGGKDQMSKSVMSHLHGKIVEAVYYNGTWKLVRIRHDKARCNNYQTYKMTMDNMKENLDIHEIMNSLKKPWEDKKSIVVPDKKLETKTSGTNFLNNVIHQ